MTYRISVSSKPGFYEQYSTSVMVNASDREDAINKAFAKLQKGVFFDRTSEMWRIDDIEIVCL